METMAQSEALENLSECADAPSVQCVPESGHGKPYRGTGVQLRCGVQPASGQTFSEGYQSRMDDSCSPGCTCVSPYLVPVYSSDTCLWTLKSRYRQKGGETELLKPPQRTRAAQFANSEARLRPKLEKIRPRQRYREGTHGIPTFGKLIQTTCDRTASKYLMFRLSYSRSALDGLEFILLQPQIPLLAKEGYSPWSLETQDVSAHCLAPFPSNH